MAGRRGPHDWVNLLLLTVIAVLVAGMIEMATHLQMRDPVGAFGPLTRR